jgi:DNA invertase Pin-like site-specific DNA recombinase
VLGVFAEFETSLRKEWQMEGIAKAKAAGIYKGRPASIDPAQVHSSRLRERDRHRLPSRHRPRIRLPRLGGMSMGLVISLHFENARTRDNNTERDQPDPYDDNQRINA